MNLHENKELFSADAAFRRLASHFPLSSGNIPVFPDRSAKLCVLSVKSVIPPDEEWGGGKDKLSFPKISKLILFSLIFVSL